VGLKFMIVPEHFPDVRARLTNPRHLALHAMHSCIVRRQRKRKIASVKVEKTAQLFSPASDILNRLVHVCDA